MRGVLGSVCFAVMSGVAAPAAAQVVGVPQSTPLPQVVQPAPQPATKLEGFQAAAGAIVTTAHEELGTIVRSRVSIDVRDMRDSTGAMAGGLTLNIVESPTRNERVYIDVDELALLLRNIDLLLKYQVNPTQLKRFEARYTTRGALALIAYTNNIGTMEYAIQAGRPLLTLTNIDAVEILKLRGFIELGLQKLNAAGYVTAPITP